MPGAAKPPFSAKIERLGSEATEVIAKCYLMRPVRSKPAPRRERSAQLS